MARLSLRLRDGSRASGLQRWVSCTWFWRARSARMNSWAGVLCGGAATAVSVLVRDRGERRFRFLGGGGLHRLTEALARLPLETWQVAAQLARPGIPPGILRRQARPAAEPDPRSAALRALTTLSASVAPNSYAVAELTGRHELLLHVLVDQAPGLG